MATLQTRLGNLATRIATECKALRTLISGNAADLSALTTTAKGNLVAALNEVRQLALDAGGAEINDAATNTSDAWSSQRIVDHVASQVTAILGTDVPAALNTLDELAAALGDDPSAISTITTALANRVRFDVAQTLTGPQKVQACANMGAQEAAAIGNPDDDLVAVFNTGLL